MQEAQEKTQETSSRPYSRLTHREIKQQYSTNLEKNKNICMKKRQKCFYENEAVKFFQLIQIHTNIIRQNTYKIYKEMQQREQYIKNSTFTLNQELLHTIKQQQKLYQKTDMSQDIQQLNDAKEKLHKIQEYIRLKSSTLEQHINSKQIYETICQYLQLKNENQEQKQQNLIVVKNDSSLLNHQVVQQYVKQQFDEYTNKPENRLLKYQKIIQNLEELFQTQYQYQNMQQNTQNKNAYIFETFSTKNLTDTYKNAIIVLQKSQQQACIQTPYKILVDKAIIIQNQLASQQEAVFDHRVQNEKLQLESEQEKREMNKITAKQQKQALQEIERIKIKDYSYLKRVSEEAINEVQVTIQYDVFKKMVQHLVDKLSHRESRVIKNFDSIFMNLHFQIESVQKELQQIDPIKLKIARSHLFQKEIIPQIGKQKEFLQKQQKYSVIEIPKYLPGDINTNFMIFKNFKVYTDQKTKTTDKKEKLQQIKLNDSKINAKCQFYQ